MYTLVSISVTILLPDAGARVCKGGSITLQCRTLFNGKAVEGRWIRDKFLINGNTTLNHFIVPFNSTGEELNDLLITNVGLANNNSNYSCDLGSAITRQSVILHVSGMYVQYLYI